MNTNKQGRPAVNGNGLGNQICSNTLTAGHFEVKFLLNKTAAKFAQDCGVYQPLVEHSFESRLAAEWVEAEPSPSRIAIAGKDYIAIISLSRLNGLPHWYAMLIEFPEAIRTQEMLHAFHAVLEMEYERFLSRGGAAGLVSAGGASNGNN